MSNHLILKPSMAFQSLIQSYHFTHWQRANGQYLAGSPISRIRYEYEFHGAQLRRDLFFVSGGEANVSGQMIREMIPAQDHLIFVLADRPGLVTAYMALDFSYLAPPSYLMAYQLEAAPTVDPNSTEGVVAMVTDIASIKTIGGADLPFPEDLTDTRLRHYIAAYRGQSAAYVRAARIEHDSLWVSHLFTAYDYRRKGLATALMSQLMIDAATSGERFLVLLASEAAHQLYRRLGFQDLLPVLNFVTPAATV